MSHEISNIKSVPDKFLEDYNLISATKNSNCHKYSFLSTLKYNLLLTDPPEEKEIHFYWPFEVIVTKNNIIVHFVTIEKNVSAYIDGERKAFNNGKNINECEAWD